MSVFFDAATWMFNEVKTKGVLYQEDAVHRVEKQFGTACVRTNDAGNPAFDPKVLKEFRKLSGDEVVWERGEKCWRTRQKWDAPGRQQD